jgi:hypothetical protein
MEAKNRQLFAAIGIGGFLLYLAGNCQLTVPAPPIENFTSRLVLFSIATLWLFSSTLFKCWAIVGFRWDAPGIVSFVAFGGFILVDILNPLPGAGTTLSAMDTLNVLMMLVGLTLFAGTDVALLLLRGSEKRYARALILR